MDLNTFSIRKHSLNQRALRFENMIDRLDEERIRNHPEQVMELLARMQGLVSDFGTFAQDAQHTVFDAAYNFDAAYKEVHQDTLRQPIPFRPRLATVTAS